MVSSVKRVNRVCGYNTVCVHHFDKRKQLLGLWTSRMRSVPKNKRKNFSWWRNSFFEELTPIDKRGRNETGRIAFPGSVFIHVL